jgi:hypothetical protein
LIISCAIVTNLVSSGLIRILIAVWRMSWIRSSFLRSCERYAWCEETESRFVECHRWFSEGWKLWRVRTPWCSWSIIRCTRSVVYGVVQRTIMRAVCSPLLKTHRAVYCTQAVRKLCTSTHFATVTSGDTTS